MSFVYGNSAGPGPSYYRAVIDQSWQDQGNGYYRCCANIRVQVTAGDFWGTYIRTSWGVDGNIHGVGDNYCFKDLGCRLVQYGEKWEIVGSATYNGHKSTVKHTFSPPKPTYSVNYNANGGTGAPSTQTKTWGTNLTLSDARPMREGYTFTGWNTRQDGKGTPYSPGSSYSANAGVTLYAQWSIYTYAVRYDKNTSDAVSNMPSNQTKTWRVALTLSGNTPYRNNYNFRGWGTSPSSVSPSYNAGGRYEIDAEITLYAIWDLAYVPPKAENVSIYRCDSGGNLNDEGLYVRVKFDWKTDRAGKNIKVNISTSDDKYAGNSLTVDSGGARSGKFDRTIKISNEAGLSADVDALVSVWIFDDYDSSHFTTTVPGTGYIIDILSSGDGIAFGRPATLKNTMDVEYNIKLHKQIVKEGYSRKVIDGRNVAVIKCPNDSEFGLNAFANSKVDRGSITIGTIGKDFAIVFDDDEAYSQGLENYASYSFNPWGNITTPQGNRVLTSDMIADYVVEAGSNSNGSYRKWSSGRLEMWGMKSLSGINVIGHDPSKVTYWSNAQYINLPLTSTTKVIVTASNFSNTGAYVSLSTGGNMLSNFACWIYYDSPLSNTDHHIHWRAEGTWK